MSKILIVYYSMYKHVHKMAEAIAEGVKEVPGCEVAMRRVPETLPADVITAMGAEEAQKSIAHIPVATVDDVITSYSIHYTKLYDR